MLAQDNPERSEGAVLGKRPYSISSPVGALWKVAVLTQFIQPVSKIGL
jgi:hypothetical protein